MSLATQKTSNLTGENMEATYSLVSSAVELLELRQQLVAAELRQGAPAVATFTVLPCAERTPACLAESAEDDLNEMHTNYEILTNQLLVEQARGF